MKKERRKNRRTAVIDTFQVFIVIPHTGLRKVYLNDLSSVGLSFMAESTDHFRLAEKLDVYFHLNPSLKIPLKLKVVNLIEKDDRQTRVGCQIGATNKKALTAFKTFVDLLKQLAAFI